jgi:surface protein
MNGMFFDADAFNQPLNNWDVSSVTTMEAMFAGADAFNQPLDDWDVSSVEDMNGMFGFATAFNQNLCAWCGQLGPATEVINMFLNTACQGVDTPDLMDSSGLFCKLTCP